MSIPKNAKRVFKGIIFDVYHWPQKMFDGSTAIFEKLVRQDTVVILPTVGKKIVLLKQQQPNTGWFYDLPSGRMDKAGESPKDAAARELLEETGLKASKLRLWKIYQPGGKTVHKVYFYLAHDCKKVASQNLDSGEKIIVLYKTFDEFLKMTDEPNCMLGPLSTDLLLARIHKEARNYLKNIIYNPTSSVAKTHKYANHSNW